MPPITTCSPAVSARLADPALQGLDAEAQVRRFLALCQLAGHPLMYDVLPQTGRLRWYVASVALGAVVVLGAVMLNLH